MGGEEGGGERREREGGDFGPSRTNLFEPKSSEQQKQLILARVELTKVELAKVD